MSDDLKGRHEPPPPQLFHSDEDTLRDIDWDLMDKLLGGPINKGSKVLIVTNPTPRSDNYYRRLFDAP